MLVSLVPLQVFCVFLDLPVQDEVIAEDLISERQKQEEHLFHGSHIWNAKQTESTFRLGEM